MSGRSLLRLLTGVVMVGFFVGLAPVSWGQDGATGLADSPWPKFKRDAQNTGQSPHPSIVDPYVKWTFPTGYYIRSSPVIGPDGTIYVGSEDHSLYALARDGTLRWSFETWGQINAGAPAIAADGTVYVGSIDVGTYLGRLYAVRPDGTLAWTFDAGKASYDSLSPAVAPDGAIYCGARQLHALNPDGTLRWSYATGGGINVTPALASDGTIYVLATDARLHAVNPDGSLKWTYLTPATGPNSGNLWSSPSVGRDGTVYFGTVDDNKVYALNPDGTLKWTFQAGNWIRRSPTVAPDGTIYIGEDYRTSIPPQSPFNLHALNADGSLKWSFETPSFVSSAVSLAADGTLYFASGDRFHAISPEGTVEWTTALGWIMGSAPAIDVDGTIHIGSYDNKLYAIGGQPRVLTASVDTDPDTLNLKSKGKWVTVYLELPQGYDVSDIGRSSVAVTAIGGEPVTPIYAEASPTAIGDEDGDSVPDLMMKIDRQVLQQQLSAGDVTLEISGRLASGLAFRGADTVRVLH